MLWTYMRGMPAGGTCQNLHKGFVQGEKEISKLLVMDNRYADQFVRGSPILMGEEDKCSHLKIYFL